MSTTNDVLSIHNRRSTLTKHQHKPDYINPTPEEMDGDGGVERIKMPNVNPFNSDPTNKKNNDTKKKRKGTINQDDNRKDPPELHP